MGDQERLDAIDALEAEVGALMAGYESVADMERPTRPSRADDPEPDPA